MVGRVKIVDLELEALPDSLEDLEGYEALRALVRLQGEPVGHIEIPLLSETACSETDLRRTAVERLAGPILRQLLLRLTTAPLSREGLGFGDLADLPFDPEPESAPANGPLVTVAVCTRDRAEDLRLCLDALVRLEYESLEILVVDNAPSDDATERLVKESYPWVRYICEPRPGLDWARNKAIREARGEILAYTDDDVVVDPGWVSALVEAFHEPHVMAVTGLTVPYELETPAQVIFERHGFGRGYRRRYWRIDLESGEGFRMYIGAGQYGAGANMAFRRRVFDEVGHFDPALDVGTVTNGGGDTEMFFRVLKEGHSLVYQPRALVRHRHRREYQRLRKQLNDNGIGFYSYLVRTALAYRDTRIAAARVGIWWFRYWSVRRLLVSFLRPSIYPRDLIWAEMKGSLIGLGRYQQARRNAARLVSSTGDEPEPLRISSPPRKPVVTREPTTGVRMIDLCQPLQDLDVAEHAAVRVFVTLGDRLLGKVEIDNHHRPVGATRLREAIVDQLGSELLGQDPSDNPELFWKKIKATLHERYVQDVAPEPGPRLPGEVPVSIVVPTYDRPDDLRDCLRCLVAQESSRRVEIIVVDNNPSSNLTPPVVAEFPGVILIGEKRPGRSYASNSGFTTASGEIIVSIDDDMTAPPNWLEKLVAPFTRSSVAAVTGNTLPFELETRAQRLFEDYGAFWRGTVRRDLDRRWFGSFRRQAVPTWELGGSGNTAFRASILSHPEIGLMEETLGAGTPTGTGEDIYLFYKVLKAGYTITYEPSAYAWHKHRREMRDLKKQLYAYSKGHVAYHLMTLLRDRDPRAAVYLALLMPKHRLKQLARYAKRRLLGRQYFPLRLTLTEIRGNLAGPWGLWKSYRRVKREGRSTPYLPAARAGDIKERVKAN